MVWGGGGAGWYGGLDGMGWLGGIYLYLARYRLPSYAHPCLQYVAGTEDLPMSTHASSMWPVQKTFLCPPMPPVCGRYRRPSYAHPCLQYVAGTEDLPMPTHASSMWPVQTTFLCPPMPPVCGRYRLPSYAHPCLQYVSPLHVVWCGQLPLT